MGIDVSKYKSQGQGGSKAGSSSKPDAPSKGIFSFMDKDISLFGNQLGDSRKERFYADLQILVTSGVDIRSALELIEAEQTTTMKPRCLKL